MLDRLRLLAGALVVGEVGNVLQLDVIKCPAWLVWLVDVQAALVVHGRLAGGLIALPPDKAPYVDALALFVFLVLADAFRRFAPLEDVGVVRSPRHGQGVLGIGLGLD